MLDRLQATYAAVLTALLLLNDNNVLSLLQAKGLDPGSSIGLRRRDNTYYKGIDLWDSIRAVQGNAGFNLDYLRSQFMTILSWVGDELCKKHYFDKSSELEFFRHLRNGISHGNAFHLLNGEPRRPAKFKGLEITQALHGKQVLFEFISSGDLLDLFDHTKAHLRSLP